MGKHYIQWLDHLTLFTLFEEEMKKNKHKKIFSYNNPNIYEKTAEGEEMYDVFSRLMKERVIFVSGEIEDESTNVIITRLS